MLRALVVSVSIGVTVATVGGVALVEVRAADRAECLTAAVSTVGDAMPQGYAPSGRFGEAVPAACVREFGSDGSI